MTPRIIDMKGEAGTFHNVELESFEGMGRVEFIGQCEDIGPNGQLNATAIDEPDNLIQVRGLTGSPVTPWFFMRKSDRFFFPNHKAVQVRYQAKENGVIYLLTGSLGELQLSGKGA